MDDKKTPFSTMLTLEGRIDATNELMDEINQYATPADDKLWHVYANQLVIMTTLRQIFRRLDRRKK